MRRPTALPRIAVRRVRRLLRQRLGLVASPAPPQLLGEVDAVTAAFADREGVDDRDALAFDRVRLARTIEWLEDAGFAGLDVLELGGAGLASEVVRHHFPSNRYTNTTTDLREPLPHAAENFDFILNMEVIEHVGDLRYEHATTLSGVRHALSECHRVLRRGGRMLVTTPNAASEWNIVRALRHEPPWMYEWHFREFTTAELRALLEEAGFEVRRLATEQVWHFWDFDPLRRFMRANGYRLGDRGDDTFALVARP